MSAARPRRGQSGFRALGDQFALELGQAGEDRENQSPIGSGGVDRSPLVDFRRRLQ